jgi:hypothetical protein
MLARTLAVLSLSALIISSGVACGGDDDDSGAGSGGSSGAAGGAGGKGGSGGTGGASGSSAGGKGGRGGAGGAAGSGSGGSGGKGGAGGKSGAGGTSGETLCEKYGGKDAVAGVIGNQVVGKLASDCRINAFFEDPVRTKHVVDCLQIQAQELFACAGVKYEGSKDTKGATCRTMKVAHAGLGTSDGDFDALIEDVVAGMKDANVADADIAKLAPSLTGLKGDIVEKKGQGTPSRGSCDQDAGI